MWFLLPFLLGVHGLVCVLLVLVVLMQLPRSEGLGAAFGGSVTENMFGAQTTNVLAKFTVWLGIAFFALTLLLAVTYAHSNKGKSIIQKELLDSAIPTASATPAALPATSPATAPLPAASTSPAGTTTAP